MGDRENRDLRVRFDRRLKLEFVGSKVTIDAERLSVDLVMRHIVGGRAADRAAGNAAATGNLNAHVASAGSVKEAANQARVWPRATLTWENLTGRWVSNP